MSRRGADGVHYATPRQWGEQRGYSRAKVRQQLKAGLPHFGTGPDLRIRVQEAETWLSQRVQPIVIASEEVH